MRRINKLLILISPHLIAWLLTHHLIAAIKILNFSGRPQKPFTGSNGLDDTAGDSLRGLQEGLIYHLVFLVFGVVSLLSFVSVSGLRVLSLCWQAVEIQLLMT